MRLLNTFTIKCGELIGQIEIITLIQILANFIYFNNRSLPK